MIRTLTSIVIVACLAAPAAAGNVIFDTFEAPGDLYQTGIGWTVGTPANDFASGGQFVTPAGPGWVLESVEAAVARVEGPNDLLLQLHEDSSGVPGDVLESWSFSGAMGSFGGYNPPLVGTSTALPVLAPATPYWLVASVPDSDTHAAWNWNSLGIQGLRATSQHGGAFGTAETTMATFRVTVNPVPEPGTLALFGLAGLAGLGLVRRRRRA